MAGLRETLSTQSPHPRCGVRSCLLALSFLALSVALAGTATARDASEVAGAYGEPDSFQSAPDTGDRRTRIIGGEVAPVGQWPSQAALLRSSRLVPTDAFFCGGTLIEPRWILTAAHCVEALPSPTSLDVAVGIEDLTEITPADRKSVDLARIHPDWDRESFAWDFALLRLATPSAQPTMDLITDAGRAETSAGKPARAAGWGCTLTVPRSECRGLGGLPSRLREVAFEFIDDSDCGSRASYGRSFMPEVMICAGLYPAGGKDTCFGDSGGPLTATVDGRRVLAGVTSWGDELCGAPGFPGVYSRVAAGSSWIEATIERPRFTGLVLLPRSARARAGRNVRMRVKVTNTGGSSGRATVRLRSRTPSRVRLPSRVGLWVPAGETRRKSFTIRTFGQRGGRIRILASLGGQKSSSVLKLRR